MDDALIEAFMQQHNMGKKVNRTFTTAAYENIVAEVNEKLNKNLDKEKIKNCWKTLKGNFAKCFDFFRKISTTGLAWDPTTKM